MNSFSNGKPEMFSGRDVTAILGPTNTGKTHLAIERMVAHESGVIGLPLRLLAREVYGRVAKKVGRANVALITGEEKIAPPGARYSVCTVEAMPRETDAAFVAIDEVQLAGDLERGHLFTDRILNLRGRLETLLLGAGTMEPILRRILPGVSVTSRPRMSHLAYAGPKKITRVPRRSAIVSFSANEVYSIAELIRRQRGGSAVVMGALSPRTRNAQVALYQNGDVDYLVATDAIGMGLNLDVDHVAFAQDTKFDGHQFRRLTPAEMAQIAGRAGRHVTDGTFGVTGRVPSFEDDLVEKIETHEFEPVKILQWRTRDFDFSSLEALLKSLDQVPRSIGLTRALPAVDQRALEFLSRDEDVVKAAAGSEKVRLLWDACALPDYRKIAPAQHADIIAQVFLDIARHDFIDEDYMAEQVRRADRTDGDIDTLSHRIAQVRTWTYISNRPKWLADPQHWQEKTRAVEDKLSDALHERLTKRFVDRRTSVLMKRLNENVQMEAEIGADGHVAVEGHHVGKLDGFRFTPDTSTSREDAKAIKGAAQKGLAGEFEKRAERFSICPNGDIALGSDGVLRWLGSPIGSLTSTEDWLRPRVVLLADEQLTGPARDRVQQRADRFVSHHIETLLKPLIDMRLADELSGIARGIAFRLIEGHGTVERREVAADVKSLDQDGRAALRRYGVRFGFYHVFIPSLIKPAPASLLTLLWALTNDAKDRAGYADVTEALATGRTSVVTDTGFEAYFYKLSGFRVLGPRAVRVDILERLADLIRPALFWKQGDTSLPEGAYGDRKFVVTPAMLSILGATSEDMQEVLKALGYTSEPVEAAKAAEHMDTLKAQFGPKEEAPKQDGSNKDEPKVEAPEAGTPVAEGTEASPNSADENATAQTGDVKSDAKAEAESVEDVAASSTNAGDGAEVLVQAEERAATDEEAEEPKPVLVWRQQRRDFGQGQSPRRANAGQKKSGGGRRGEGFKKPKGQRGGGKPQTVQARPPKAADPDSPFAKLQALKDQLKN
ncbi:MAG: helicase-related protein [Pseudomonadota bacterium]